MWETYLELDTPITHQDSKLTESFLLSCNRGRSMDSSEITSDQVKVKSLAFHK